MDNDKRLGYDGDFDLRYAYGGCDLGATCTPIRTIFKLWSPEASGVELYLYRDGTSGSWFDHVLLEPGDRGVWACSVEGDLHGVYYDYEVILFIRSCWACDCRDCRADSHRRPALEKLG